MRKFFTLILGVFLVSTLSAQKPEAVIIKASVAPEVDGVVDDVWEEANVYNIDKKFQAELPTLGESGETTWKALYTDEGFYLLLTVTDDSFWPSYLAGGNSYERDKPEVYFDVNYILEDGLGCQGNINSGHYQFDVAMDADHISGERGEINDVRNNLPFIYSYAFMVDAPNYIAEYYFPFSMFTTNEGGPIDLTGQVGFDVTICDSDEGDGVSPRKRAVWANIGGINESWANMDDAGIITFDGAEPPIFVEEINLTVDGAITEDNQTLQIGLEVLPEDAAVKTVKWVVTTADGSKARATISNSGLITPVLDEELTIQAISSDGFIYSNIVNVSITGQVVTLDEINYIKDGHFNAANPETGAPGPAWEGGAVVVDGVATMNNEEVDADPWGWTFGQAVNVPWARRAESFVYKFKMWADAPREIVVDFEDTNNDYPRYGVSTDEWATRSGGGVTDWLFPITTEPTWYTLNCTFENMLENARQKMNFMLGWDTPIVYVDSIYLLAVADMGLVPVIQNEMAAFNVYPNPASTKLNVELSSSNLRVAIYNSVGIKMDEVVVFGTRHTFDVSRYTKGLYFVKAGGTVVKFIK